MDVNGLSSKELAEYYTSANALRSSMWEKLKEDGVSPDKINENIENFFASG